MSAGAAATRNVELLDARFDPALASTAGGAVALDFRLADQHANLSFGAGVARLEAAAWVEVPEEELVVEARRLSVAPRREGFGARMVIWAKEGWTPGAVYRVRFSAAQAGDPDDLVLDDTFTWQVKPKATATTLAPIVFEKRFPTRFDSAAAAADTLGGRFPGGQPILFQGAWTDPVTGLAYHRGRWYDPRNGVFLSPDPVGPVDSTNLYAFVGWRPADRTDPTGLLGGSDYADEAFLRAMREKAACGARCDVATNVGRGLDALGDAAIERGSTAGATAAYLASNLTPANDALAIGEVLGGGELARGLGASARWLARTSAAQRFFVTGAGRLLTTDVRTLLRRLAPFDDLVDDAIVAGAREGVDGLTPTGFANVPRTGAVVDESVAASRAAGTTRLGVRRANAADWRQTRDVWDNGGYGDILSAENRAFIARGRTPVVDDAWIQHFPGDAALRGEQIRMHHVGGSRITVPMPESRHLDAHMPGGYRRNPGGPGTSG